MKVAEDAVSVGTMGTTAFFLGDVSRNTGEGTLFSCSNGRTKKQVADDVTEFTCYFKMITYRTDDEVYYSADGKHFQEVK